MFRALWMDEGGGLLCAEMLILSSILFCASVVGLSIVRDAVVSELADVAAMIGSVNQSVSVGGISSDHAGCAGWSFTDAQDVGDSSNVVCGAQGGGDGQGGLVLCAGAGSGHSG